MIGVGVILGMIAVTEQCMKGEALYMIATIGAEALYMIATTGAEALFMMAMIGEEALAMINISLSDSEEPVRGRSGKQHDFAMPSIPGSAVVS